MQWWVWCWVELLAFVMVFSTQDDIADGAARWKAAEEKAMQLSSGEAPTRCRFCPFSGGSDERIYCSELVWKIFQRGTGLEIGGLAMMGDFDRSHPAVKAKLEERFGSAIPQQETVISPSAIFDAPELQTVCEN